MPCHQHRCCRRAASAADVTLAVDYILLAAADPNVTEGAATMLRGAGVPVERHELGLRLSTRGTGYKAALAHLCDTLAPAARRGMRVVFIPVGADAIGFQRALLASLSLETFQHQVAAVPATTGGSPAEAGLFGDVFKGESLE